MSEQALSIVLLLLPLLIGGVIAAVNAEAANHATERVEGWVRAREKRGGGVFRYVFGPLLWAIVRFCDWTDGFAHRGVKNGARVALTLYVIALWLFLLYVAVIIVIGVVVFALIIYVVAKVLSSGGSEDTPASRADERDEALRHAGYRGKRVYSGTNWMNEELQGRVDEEGNIYRGTNWLNEEKIGRIDEEGTIYRGTSWMNEEKVGRLDEDGHLYKGTNWWNEELTGRIDEDGAIQEGTNWLNEEQKGRIGD